MTDLRDELRDAERAVYARPGIGETEADRAAAVERLRSLREKIREHERRTADAARAEIVAAEFARDVVEPDTPPANHTEPHAPVGRRFRIRARWIVVAVVAVAVVASWLVMLGIPQPSSLEIFDRPQTAEERDVTVPGRGAGSIDYDSIRILAIGGDWEAFAYKLDTGDICVTLVGSDIASGGCISSDQFAATGIQMSTSSFAGPDATPGIDLQWGPLGPPQVEYPDK